MKAKCKGLKISNGLTKTETNANISNSLDDDSLHPDWGKEKNILVIIAIFLATAFLIAFAMGAFMIMDRMQS